MKRVLLDQGLAPRAAALLRADGWEALHVSEVGLDRAGDPAILDLRANEDWSASLSIMIFTRIWLLPFQTVLR